MFNIFSKSESKFLYYILAIVRNLMLNASRNYVSKNTHLKFLIKNGPYKNKKNATFKKMWPVAWPSVQILTQR